MIVLFCKKLHAAVVGNVSFHKGNEGACFSNSRQSFSQLIIPIELCMS